MLGECCLRTENDRWKTHHQHIKLWNTISKEQHCKHVECLSEETTDWPQSCSMWPTKVWWTVYSVLERSTRCNKVIRGTYQMQLQELMQRQMKLSQARITVYKMICLCRTVLSYSKTNIPIAYRNMFKVNHKTPRKGVNLVQG